MKIRKTTVTWQTVLKERQRAQKLVQKAKEELQTAQFCKKIARSILAGRGKYNLKVNNADTFQTSSLSNIKSYSENSVWAPWNPLAK